MSQRLLVVVDASPNSPRALHYAVKLSELCPIEFHLVTVVPEPVLPGKIPIYVTKARMVALQRERGEELLQPALETAKGAGVACTSALLLGNLVDQIAAEAERSGCNGIVLGKPEGGVLANILSGSLVSKLISRTKCPVTVVP